MYKTLRKILIVTLAIIFNSAIAMEQTQPIMAFDSTVFEQHLKRGKELMDDRLDYKAALNSIRPIFSYFEQKPLDSINALEKPFAVQAYISFAMACHHIGEQENRDGALEKARLLLQLPENFDSFSTWDSEFYFSDSVLDRYSIDYCIVAGYQHYVRYEQAKKLQKSSKKQQAILTKATKFFEYALAVAKDLKIKTFEKTHALQGLGTVYEFLAKSIREENLENENAALPLGWSLGYFQEALKSRIKLLGDNHLQVARSHHKLARIKKYIATIEYKEDSDNKETDPEFTPEVLIQEAGEHYQKALAIFEHNGIAKDHVKYKELLEEYEGFTKQ